MILCNVLFIGVLDVVFLFGFVKIFLVGGIGFVGLKFVLSKVMLI